MREIKFRLWNPSRKVLTDGVHLNTLLMTTDMDFVTAFNQEKMVWMQYTELKDSFGKDIYEGDIFDIHQTVNGQNTFYISSLIPVLEVKYCCDDRIYEYDVEELLEVYIPQDDKTIEVVGNIYKNPELLTNKQ